GDHHECLESVGSKPSSVAFGRQDLPPRTILHTELVWSTEAVQEQAVRVVAANDGCIVEEAIPRRGHRIVRIAAIGVPERCTNANGPTNINDPYQRIGTIAVARN